jgi:hypothetical protein
VVGARNLVESRKHFVDACDNAPPNSRVRYVQPSYKLAVSTWLQPED